MQENIHSDHYLEHSSYTYVSDKRLGKLKKRTKEKTWIQVLLKERMQLNHILI